MFNVNLFDKIVNIFLNRCKKNVLPSHEGNTLLIKIVVDYNF